MKQKQWISVDGNEAVALTAHKINEVIAIYPITPSSPMGELSDAMSAKGEKNIWGTVPEVVELQSEGGASGAVHGALTSGALTTTFTSSQGLLLMIPNMFKIAGELTPTVFHVAARAVAAAALNIFGEHSDIYAARMTGWAMLAANSVQEAHDMALIAQAASLESRLPFVHFFDGFRTSHEVQKIEKLTEDEMRAMIDPELVRAHRERGLNPDNPSIRGTSQNPDVFFATRETVNPFVNACPAIVQKVMDKFYEVTGRRYHIMEYYGAPDAERVIVIMGSGAETVAETVDYLNAKGEKVGVLKVRLFRPFSGKDFLAALPATVKSIAVLDRTKEPGAAGEPLYQDVRAVLGEDQDSDAPKFAKMPRVVGGRYGLGSKEFDPAMVIAVFKNLSQPKPKNSFTIGIFDDVTNTSLEWDLNLSIEPDDVQRAVFYGLGSDGTVGANKNSIKIIGEGTDYYAQGYFVYDSKKAGSVTVSHLRFGPRPIRSTYLIKKAQFVACHNFTFMKTLNVLDTLAEGGVFLLNSPYGAQETWSKLPAEVQKTIIAKKAKFYVMQASKIALIAGMQGRINTVMQVGYFLISGVLPKDQAIAMIKKAIEKTYARKGADVVAKNIAAVDAAINGVEEVNYPSEATSTLTMVKPIIDAAPEFFHKVTAKLIAGQGDFIPVSALPKDGTWPTATTKYEKRSIAEFVPTWDAELCIQCNKCSIVCPHAVIRAKIYDKKHLEKAPDTFKWVEAKGKEYAGMAFTIQISPDDCTNCRACFNICPAVRKGSENQGDKAIKMASLEPIREREQKNWAFFQTLPDLDMSLIKRDTTKGSQLIQPLFEFSGACAGCGETPYIKVISQLFGDRMIIANATGCSSIYGGNLPTTPYTTNHHGRGPAWSNSLFEDNAEFGYGMRLASDRMGTYARELLEQAKKEGGWDNAVLDALLSNPQSTPQEIDTQRDNIKKLKDKAKILNTNLAKELLSVADYLVKRSVWIIGGDGWAYDIGYGGLDHVLASGRDVNVLVLDTEVYSNTGGQMSKATPLGAIAKFAAGGKPIGKKNLGMMAMSYGYVYVAALSMGYNQDMVVRTLLEAESYKGPSLIIAYSHCIAHGIDMSKGMNQQKAMVESGLFPCYTYDPRRKAQGQNPFKLLSTEPKVPVEQAIYEEQRYRALRDANPEAAATALEGLRVYVQDQYKMLARLAAE